MTTAWLFALPVLCTMAAWAIGRWLTALTTREPAPHAESVFVGLAAVWAILSMASFTGVAGTAASGWLALLLLVLALASGRRHLRVGDGRALLLAAMVPLLACLHFLWPLIVHPGTDIVLFHAGDYHQYMAMASWLQDHPMTSPAQLGEGFNTLQMNVADHQRNYLRIGALLLMSLFTRAGAATVPQAYSLYCAFIVGMLALSVTLLARRVAPNLPPWAALLAGLLFGLSPTVTWAAYASFIPQTIGLAFLVAGIAALVPLLGPDAKPAGWRETLRQAAPTGLVLAAAWSCYPEAAAPGALIVLLFLLLAHGRSLLRRDTLRTLLRTSAGVLAAWILASPVNFWWGLRGLVVQAHSLAHGGEQNASLWTLFGMAVGAMQQPLVRDAGHFTGAWHEFASIAACLLAAAGVVHAVLSRQRALPVAVAVASAILFAFVAHRYTMPPSTAMPEPRTILTWNLFKAASFLAPFVFTVAIMGTLSLALQRGGQRLLKAAAGVLTGMLLMVALHQATWGAGQMTLVRLSPELPALAARVPPGRLLVDVHNGDGAIDYYQRYAAYSLLGGHRFLSARDWYPGELEDLLKPVRKTLAEPFATVLTDRPGDYPQLPTIAHAGAYSILDARGQDLRTELQSFDGVRLPLVSLGASAAPRTVDAQVYNLRPGRMLVAGPREIRVLPVADAPMQQATLQVPPEGMLAQLVFDPAPRGRAEVFLRDAGVTAPPAQPVDLLPLLTDASISTDPNGARMALQPAERGVRLAQDRAGTSRARAALELEPGEYLLHIELGAVAVRDKAAGGFGAFFGPENDHAASIELEPLAHGHHYLRVSVAKKQTLFYVIGFGGWGSASGSMELRALELVRRPGLAGRA